MINFKVVSLIFSNVNLLDSSENSDNNNKKKQIPFLYFLLVSCKVLFKIQRFHVSTC